MACKQYPGLVHDVRVNTRRRQYHDALGALAHPVWPPYLREPSGRPGPRANLELAQAVADAGDPSVFDSLRRRPAVDRGPTSGYFGRRSATAGASRWRPSPRTA
jgi:hypothetical protein